MWKIFKLTLSISKKYKKFGSYFQWFIKETKKKGFLYSYPIKASSVEIPIFVEDNYKSTFILQYPPSSIIFQIAPL